MNLHQWAIKNGVTAAALQELQREVLGLLVPVLPTPKAAEGKSEAFVQSLVKLRASQEGVIVTRNNVGALIPKDSKRPIRFGLWNESEEMNEVIKSGDLVGIRKLLIEPHHVGTYVAQWWMRECKEPGWYYTGEGREPAQKACIDMVNAAGGDAAFSNGAGL
jgi:hypothetical protein